MCLSLCTTTTNRLVLFLFFIISVTLVTNLLIDYDHYYCSVLRCTISNISQPPNLSFNLYHLFCYCDYYLKHMFKGPNKFQWSVLFSNALFCTALSRIHIHCIDCKQHFGMSKNIMTEQWELLMENASHNFPSSDFFVLI